MRFTAIHRALGVQPQELTWDMLVRAVDQGVVEQPDLDWKREGYGAKKDWDELAKDVAAMANSGGGIIVLGVQEDHATSAARELITADLSASEEGNYRQAIFTRTHPPVQGALFQSLTSPADEDSVVLIYVPASPDAPHLVYRDRTRMDEFVAPFRDGSHTRFMAERQLEAAYRQRFAGRSGRDADLASLYEDAATVFDPEVRACLVAVAYPGQRRPEALGRLDQNQVREVFVYAKNVLLSRLLLSDSVSVLTDVNLDTPRLGLRRHTAHGYYGPDDLKHHTGVVSLHDDGAISLAWTAGGFRDQEHPFDVHSFMVERTAADLVALVAATSRELGLDSGYTLQLGITHPDGTPLRVWHQPDPHWDKREPSAPIRRLVPVQTSLAPQPDDEDLVVAARDLALDFLSQAGVSRLTHLRKPEA